MIHRLHGIKQAAGRHRRCRHLALLAGAGALSLAAAACGSSGASTASAGPALKTFSWTAAKGQTINLMLNEHNYEKALVDQLPQFEKQTGITVHYEVIPEETYFTKLSTALSSKNGSPDAFMTGVYQMWSYATAGYMQNLSALLSKHGWTSPSYDLSDYIPGVLAGDRWDLKVGDPAGTGPLWALPMGWENYVITYNKKAFAKAGIKLPFTSLQNLASAAAKLKGWNGPGSYGICVRGYRGWGTIHPDVMSLMNEWGATDLTIKNGHLHAAMDSPQAIAMTRTWAQMVRNGGEPGFNTYDWPQCQTDLGDGKAAMIYDADILGFFTDLPGAYATSGSLADTPPPPGPNGKISSNEWIWSLAMNSSSHHKLATWLLMQWMTGKQHDLWGALHGLLVDNPRESVANNPSFIAYEKKVEPGYHTLFGKMSKVAAIRFTPEPDFFQAATEWASMLENIVAGSTTAHAGLTSLAHSLDTTMATVPVTGHMLSGSS